MDNMLAGFAIILSLLQYTFCLLVCTMYTGYDYDRMYLWFLLGMGRICFFCSDIRQKVGYPVKSWPDIRPIPRLYIKCSTMILLDNARHYLSISFFAL